MHKSMAFVLLLSLCSLGMLGGAHFKINENRDAVTITETVLAGDPAAAAGLLLKNRAVAEQQLFWDTAYTPGSGEPLQVEFTFYPTKQKEESSYVPHLSLYVGTNYAISGDSIDLRQEARGFLSELALLPAQDVAGRTAAGQTRRETVRMQDYYEFYPLSVNGSFLSGDPEEEAKMRLALSEYFRIPVPAGHQLEVRITKNDLGDITGVDVNSIAGDLNFSSNSVFTSEGCYMALSVNAYEEQPVCLTSGISGIHFIPFLAGESGRNILNFQEIRQVYALPQEVREVFLEQSADSEELLLFTLENDALWLTVLPFADPARPGQRLLLAESLGDTSLLSVQIYEDFQAVLLSDQSFFLLSKGSSEGYTVQMQGSLEACPAAASSFWADYVMDYDGSRLAVAYYEDHYKTCNTYLLIYTGQGRLSYGGKYSYSFNQSPTYTYQETCRPVEVSPLSVIWQ